MCNSAVVSIVVAVVVLVAIVVVTILVVANLVVAIVVTIVVVAIAVAIVVHSCGDRPPRGGRAAHGGRAESAAGTVARAPVNQARRLIISELCVQTLSVSLQCRAPCPRAGALIQADLVDTIDRLQPDQASPYILPKPIIATGRTNGAGHLDMTGLFCAKLLEKLSLAGEGVRYQGSVLAQNRLWRSCARLKLDWERKNQ